MKLIPVGLCLFYRQLAQHLEVWVQVREDDGIYQGLLEFPGGGVEPGETPLAATIREVQEEVGITIQSEGARLMGQYLNELSGRKIILYVYIYADDGQLDHKGQWLKIERSQLSSPFMGKIPAPNHQIIDDLFHSLFSS